MHLQRCTPPLFGQFGGGGVPPTPPPPRVHVWVEPYILTIRLWIWVGDSSSFVNIFFWLLIFLSTSVFNLISNTNKWGFFSGLWAALEYNLVCFLITWKCIGCMHNFVQIFKLQYLFYFKLKHHRNNHHHDQQQEPIYEANH